MFTSPPVVIDAPGKIASKAIRSIGVVPVTTSGPDSSASWKPSMSAISPLLTVIWPILRTWPRFASPYAKLWAKPLLLLLPERIDRQLGILGRAVDDDADPAARHGIGPDGADRLRIGRGCLDNLLLRVCGGRGPCLTVCSFRDVGRQGVGGVRQADHVVGTVGRGDLDVLAAPGRLCRDDDRHVSEIREWEQWAGASLDRNGGLWRREAFRAAG